jgi:hypothetical protein
LSSASPRNPECRLHGGINVFLSVVLTFPTWVVVALLQYLLLIELNARGIKARAFGSIFGYRRLALVNGPESVADKFCQ